MIFVTLGTQDKSFTRLLEAVDKEIKNNKIKDKVIVQAGHTKYQSNKMKIYDYLDHKEFEKYMKEADLIITHGGVGSILSALKMNKIVIVCPRLSKYDEHENDHQKEITDNFAKQGYIIPLNENDNLAHCLSLSKKFKPKKYHENNKEFNNKLEEYIKTTHHISWWNRYGKVIFIFLIIYFIILFILKCIEIYYI